MPNITRTGTAVWNGPIKDGGGQVSVESGVLQDDALTFAARFESGTGTNPEELIAAAHAGCFSMALSGALTRNGTPPKEIKTVATITLRKDDTGTAITKIHLDTEAEVPGVDNDTFLDAAMGAKDGCPVSKLLAPGLDSLTLDAKLVQ